MRYFLSAAVIGLIAMLGLSSTASAQSLKKVSPDKFETRAPLKGYSFDRVRPLNENDATAFPDGLSLVTYRKDEGYGSLAGVLDSRNRRAEWILQPHFAQIEVVGHGLLAIKSQSGLEENYCVFDIKASACEPTDKNRLVPLGDINIKTLPNWVADQALARTTDTYGTLDLQIYGASGQLITEVKNAVHDKDNRVSAFSLGNALVIRTSPTKGELADLVISRLEDGRVTKTVVPLFSILQFSERRQPVKNGQFDYSAPKDTYEGFELMFTANAELGLVWPYYETETGFQPAPADLIGLKPLDFYFFNPTIEPKVEFRESYNATHYCCHVPLGWTVTWETPDGIRHALLRQKTIPTYEEVMGSREKAVYRRFEPLWQPARGNDAQTLAQDQGQLIGQYGFHRTDGTVEIYQEDFYGINDGGTMQLLETIPEARFSGWLTQKMQDRARKRATAVQELAAIRRAMEEHDRQMDAAWAAAEKRADDINAQRAAAAAERRAKAAEERAARDADRARQDAAEQAVMDSEIARYEAWNSWRKDSNLSSGSTVTAPVDYWKSYDSSNTTGQYTTSSGAASGCPLGNTIC